MNNRLLSVLGVFILVLLSMSAVSAADYPMTITDSAGREITFSQPVERVIVLSSDAAEAVVMLRGSRQGGRRLRYRAKKGYYFPSSRRSRA